MTTRRWIGVLVVVSGLLASCTSTPPGMSCSFTSSGVMACIDFVAGYTSVTASAGCSAANGAYNGSASCTSASRVGRCTQTLTNSGGTATYIVNYYAPATTAQAMTQCPPASPMANTTYEFTAN